MRLGPHWKCLAPDRSSATNCHVNNPARVSVFLAQDRAVGGTQVVVKLVNSEHPDEIKRELFRREATALQMLSHHNIVRLLHSGWSESHSAFYLVLDYLPYSLNRYLNGEIQSQLNGFDP